MIVGCKNVEFPLKLSSIQSTRLRMRWVLGVWMLSYLEIILHSVNSSEDGMIVGCMNVELPLKLSSIQSTRLRMGWLLGVCMLSSLWNYPPFSQLDWGQTQSMDHGLTKSIFPFENIFSLSIESLYCLTILLPHTSIPLSLTYLIPHQIFKYLFHVYSRSLFMFPLNVAEASTVFLYVLKYCPQSFLETK
jgi:hypothetical protein